MFQNVSLKYKVLKMLKFIRNTAFSTIFVLPFYYKSRKRGLVQNDETH